MKQDETPKAFLTGMKPGQTFEEFKDALCAALKARGFFAKPKNEEGEASTQGELGCPEDAKKHD